MTSAVPPENEATFGLAISANGIYPSACEEHAFVHGIEFGLILARLQRCNEAKIEVTTREENREIIRRAAAAERWCLDVLPSGIDGWDKTVLVKVWPAEPDRRGLRLVK